MVLRRLLILLFTLSASAIAMSQTVNDAIEQWMDDGGNEEAAAELSDMLEAWREEPLNLNDTALIDDMPLLTPFQRKGLRNYITLYGQLLSLAELPMVPGFDSTSIEALYPYFTVAPIDDQGPLRWWQGRHSFISGIGGTVEKAAGYGNGHYKGDNLRALACYTYNYRNKVSIRLATDKDAGEVWGDGNYYNYHIMLSDIGQVERLIFGRYNLQFGQGLTLWTGLQPFNFMGRTPMRCGSGVKLSSTFYEENYQEGAAATVRLWRNLHLSAFASHAGGINLAGGHLELRNRTLVVGITTVHTSLYDSTTARDYVYNANMFRGNRLFNGGVDAKWQWHRFNFYGEAACDADMHKAAIVGVNINGPSGNSVGMSFRHYDDLYHSLTAQGYTAGINQGEQGLSIDATMKLPWKLRAVMCADLHSFSILRYGKYSPSTGGWLKVHVERPIGKHTIASMRYNYRQKERNIPYDNHNPYLCENTLRRQLQTELRAETGPWKLTVRAIYSTYNSENGKPQNGWLTAIAARYTNRQLQATAGVAWFNVDGYYARLYLSESNLQYAWSIPALTGRGLRGHLLVRFRLGQNITLAARYAITLLPEQESIGSGDNATEGAVRQTWHFQIRWKL